DWLDPDWVYDPAANEFQWRCLHGREETVTTQDSRSASRRIPGRPAIELEIARVHRAAWQIFRPHPYLSGELHKAATCFVAFVVEQDDGVERETLFDSSAFSTRRRPAAFTAVIHRPDPGGGYWAEHRTVCLPDFQGVGIGNTLSEFVASLFVATGKRYCS